VLLKQVTVEEPSLFGPECGGVQFGINVFNSTNVRIDGCFARGDTDGYTGIAGYQDAGIYISGIPSEGNVRVKDGLSHGNNRGIILEDSTDIPGGKATVRVEKSSFASNDTGIFVRNSDGMRIERNGTLDQNGTLPAVGIELDSTSDDNLIRRNRFLDAAVEVIDNGTSNCWLDNELETGTAPTGGCD
jgi:hypothetical protein